MCYRSQPPIARHLVLHFFHICVHLFSKLNISYVLKRILSVNCLPTLFDAKVPSKFITQTTLNANRSTPSLRLHATSHNGLGSMGITLSTKYTVVARDLASSSKADSVPLEFRVLTKCETSAICTL